jgi:hypothetical protein
MKKLIFVSCVLFIFPSFELVSQDLSFSSSLSSPAGALDFLVPLVESATTSEDQTLPARDPNVRLDLIGSHR